MIVLIATLSKVHTGENIVKCVAIVQDWQGDVKLKDWKFLFDKVTLISVMHKTSDLCYGIVAVIFLSN